VVRIDAEDQKLELTVSGRTESKKDAICALGLIPGFALPGWR
jgi:hypothetical protein